MAEIIYGIVLGIVQGLGEFLPISSSGHLELAKYIFNDKSVGEESLWLSIVLHIGTAASTLVVFRKEVAELFKGLFSTSFNEEKKFALKIIISMIPAVFIGLVFEKQLETFFESKIHLVCIFLICTAVLLFISDQSTRKNAPLDYKNSFIIGIAQAIAILPGISRSGSTIATSVLLGIDKKDAARFSFLMVLPLIFGKLFQEILSGEALNHNLSLKIAIPGFITSFLVGLFACQLMVELVKKSKLHYFAYYCATVGVLGLIYYFFFK